MTVPATPAALRALLEPTLERLGFDLVAVELAGGRRRRTLRLTIDKPGGVGADDCARVSHRVSPVLDAEDPISGAYDLEVSSPGIDRPLQRRTDFARFRGYRARIRLEEGLPRRRYTGALAGFDGDDLQVDIDGEIHRIPFASIAAAHLELDLEAFASLKEGLPPVPEEVADDHQ